MVNIFIMKIYKLIGFITLIGLLSCGQVSKNTTTLPSIGQSKKDSIEAANLPSMETESHGVIMDLAVGKPKQEIKKIGILVYDGVNELDFMGPLYVLGQIMGATTELIAIEPGTFLTGRGIEITPHNYIDGVKQLDILVIPGGFKGTILSAYNDKLHQWIREIDQTTTYTASVCTGGWILGATGLLKGKKATTNWYEAEKMMAKYGATFLKERYVKDGKYWTSAGVTAGMDMSLAMLNDIWGERYTQAVMLDMEYDPAPPVSGGSPEKTGFVPYRMMKMMYDAGIEPLIDSLEQNEVLKRK